MIELINQMGGIAQSASQAGQTALEMEKAVCESMLAPSFPTDAFGAPLAGSLLPWIDREVENGMSREEWKGEVETARILGNEGNPIPVDGLCVRVGCLRCHSQAFTIKLKSDIPLDEIECALSSANDWVKFVPNTKEETLKHLTPASVTGGLTVPVGRVRKMKMGGDYLSAFSVGDQLLWGAAEPLRRMLKILRER